MKIKNRKFLSLFLLFLIFGATVVSAAGKLCDTCVTGGCDTGFECQSGKCHPICSGICFGNPIRACNMEDLINTIITFIFWIALAVAPLIIIIGAFYIMTAGADPKRVETGKNIILYTLIGLILVLLSKGIIAFIIKFLG